MGLLEFINIFLAHEGHFHPEGNHLKLLFNWVGHSHYIFLHFPIALIIMATCAEILFLWTKSSFFSNAARFMVISAAVFCLPTILFGFFLSYEVGYKGTFETVFYWHLTLGILITCFAILTAFLNEGFYQKGWKTRVPYLCCLALLFIMVNATSFFGGILTFGLDTFLPPH